MTNILEFKSEFIPLNEIKIETEEFEAEESRNFERNVEAENESFASDPFLFEEESIKCEEGNQNEEERKSKLGQVEEDKNEASDYHILKNESNYSCSAFDKQVNLSEHAKKSRKKCAQCLKITNIPQTSSSSKIVDNFSRCHHCFDFFDCKDNLIEKTNHSFQKEIRKFNCDVCSFSFHEKFNLEFHIRSVHQKEKPFKCGECESTFSRKSNVAKHIKIVHQKLKPYKCRFCKFRAGNESDLEYHVQSVHQKVKYKCSGCKYSTCVKTCLFKHILAVHQKLRPHKCNDCNYSSFQKSNLLVHISKIHVSKQHVKCKKSDATCRTSTGNCTSEQDEPPVRLNLKLLKWNDRDHSRVTKDTLTLDTKSTCSRFNSFKCSECDYTCSVKGSLSLHTKVAHSN